MNLIKSWKSSPQIRGRNLDHGGIAFKDKSWQVPANGVLELLLPQAGTHLRGMISYPAEFEYPAPLICTIETAGKILWQVELRRNILTAAEFELPLPAGTRMIKLSVSAEHHGFYFLAGGLWSNLKATANNGEIIEICTDDAGDFPIRFNYGGVDSRTFLADWPRREEPGKIVFFEPDGVLEVALEYQEYPEFNAIYYWSSFTNTGRVDTALISEIKGGVWSKKMDSVRFVHSHGSLARIDDFLYVDETVKAGTVRHFEPTGGRSSSGILPYFLFADGQGGTIHAIGWGGQWGMDIAYDGITVEYAQGVAGTNFKLYPGESIRQSSSLQLDYSGDIESGHNRWRQLMIKHFSPVPAPAPVSMMHWGGMKTADHLNRIAEYEKQKIDYDYYWIDAGWYGNCDHCKDEGGNWGINVGSWYCNKETHPDGFTPITDALTRNGKKFLLWFELLRACPGTELLKDYPQWFMEEKEGAYSFVFNLGIPEACDFLIDFAVKLIKKYKVDFYRQDFNFEVVRFWKNNDQLNRQGLSQIKFCNGFWRFWDTVLEKCPGLYIDNCCAGGRMLDFETVRRSIALWRSDFPGRTEYDMRAPQVNHRGLAPWVPLSASSPDCQERDTYNVRSVAHYGIDWRVGMYDYKPIPEDYPFDWLRARIAECRKIARLSLGDFYPLTSVDLDPARWVGWEYLLTDKSEGMFVMFRRDEDNMTSGIFKLKGLDESAVYSLTDADTGKIVERSGRDLMKTGVEITMLQPHSSTLIFLQKNKEIL